MPSAAISPARTRSRSSETSSFSAPTAARLKQADELFQFEQAEFRYDPYPIGYIREIISPDQYDDLSTSYPPLELFQEMPTLGRKYSLSERNRPEQYHGFIESQPVWKRLH